MRSSGVRKVVLLAGTVAVLAVSHVGCGRLASRQAPTIAFSRIPPADQGGPLGIDVIEGRVSGASPGQKIVLYARSGPWWVQPYADQPLTDIQPDGTWHSSTHLGTYYAALLVDPTFKPPASTDLIPSVGSGVEAVAMTRGEPAFWQRRWFVALCLVTLMTAILLWYRYRMKEVARQLNLRFDERLAERNRIAHELHDTLLQGFVSASMQLHVAIDKLPDESPARPQLTRVVQLMGSVIEEGRNAVRGLRSVDLRSDDLEQAFATMRSELSADESTEYRVIAEGRRRTLHPVIRDEVYRVVREALANAFRHAEAHHIEVEIRYGWDRLEALVRDDGRGIDAELLQTGREGHFGLSGMRERAEAIGAGLHVRSRIGAGTEIELSVPSKTAYQDHVTRRWWSAFRSSKTEPS